MRKIGCKLIGVMLVLAVILSFTKAVEANSDAEELETNSRIALIYDRASGQILYEKNGEKQTPMASTTKIMTAIVVLENADLTETVTINSKAAGIGGSRL